MKKLRGWLIGVLAIALIGVGAAAAVGATQFMPNLFAAGKTEVHTSEIISAVTREEQVVLLSLAIQGISVKDQGPTKFMGVDVPGSERASFLEYSFKAKVGLDGRSVRIERAGEKGYVVTIPKFIFIGHSDEKFRVAAERNGALSFASAPIDSMAMVNTLLGDESQQGYIDSNVEVLKAQAQSFYTGIIAGIDPEASLRFEFADQS